MIVCYTLCSYVLLFAIRYYIKSRGKREERIYKVSVVDRSKN
jgi:hypothetical protein